MKYEVTASFHGDWRRLSEQERNMFRSVVREDFHPAAVHHVEEPAAAWPRSLRVRAVVGAPGVLEMTWSFTGPDGRATFEWVRIGGEAGIRWRRIGGHEVFGAP